MQTKLTVRMDDALIARAKAYAKATDRTLSQLISGYFEMIVREKEQPKEGTLPPITSSLAGVLEGIAINEREYKDYLEHKHQ